MVNMAKCRKHDKNVIARAKVNQSLLSAEECCLPRIIVEELDMLFFAWQEERG
jgi:hypothetical protein